MRPELQIYFTDILHLQYENTKEAIEIIEKKCKELTKCLNDHYSLFNQVQNFQNTHRKYALNYYEEKVSSPNMNDSV
jgi:hypothetical protein